MIKLIICDCDGTLLTSGKKVDEGIKDLMPILKEKGIFFTIATGRNEELVDKYIDEIGIDVPYITDNGATIYKNHELELIYDLPQEYNRKIIDIVLSYDVPFVYFAKEGSYLYKNSPFFQKRLKPFFDRGLMKDFEDHEDVESDHVFKITMDFESLPMDKRDEAVRRVKECCPLVNYGPGEGDIYSLNSIKAGKGNSLNKLKEMLDIKTEETIAFGDNFNDLPLLKEAGKAVVMANSENKLKEMGYEVCGDNDHQGVSEYIRKHLLK